MRTLIMWSLVAVTALACAGCSQEETIELSAVVENTDASSEADDHVAKTARQDAFADIVAGISVTGAAGAEAAWAEQRPTLLLFAAGG